MSTISVIIPAFNAENTIRETIESVLRQTFSDLEIIVINDGSTDSTVEIINSIRDQRIKLFSYRSGSAAGSRNRGLSHASGKFIAFLDADDLWAEDKLEKQLSALQQNPEAILSYSWVDYINEQGSFIGRGSRVSETGNVLHRLLLSNFLNNGSNPLIRQEAFLETGKFDETLSNAEDWDLYLKLAARYKFIAVPYPHVLYRVTQTSKSFNTLKMEASLRKIIRSFFVQAPESVAHLKDQCFASCYRYLIFKTLEIKDFRKRNLAVLRLFISYVLRTSGRLRFLRFKWLLASVIAYDFLFKLFKKDFLKKKLKTPKARVNRISLSYISESS